MPHGLGRSVSERVIATRRAVFEALADEKRRRVPTAL
jgi:hypothetical protein